MNEYTIRHFFRCGADNVRSENSLELMLRKCPIALFLQKTYL